MTRIVAAMQPNAAKDVSMAGVVGTIGMMAEASGTGADIDVAAVPRPDNATMGAWLSCFPGFGMLTAGSVPRLTTSCTSPPRSPSPGTGTSSC